MMPCAGWESPRKISNLAHVGDIWAWIFAKTFFKKQIRQTVKKNIGA
jgi:hypothetical protein